MIGTAYRVRRLMMIMMSGAAAAVLVATMGAARSAAAFPTTPHNHQLTRRPPPDAVGMDPHERRQSSRDRPILFQRWHGRPRVLVFSSASSLTTTASQQLASSYPTGTPPGLRGEAIRSALRSNRCLLYKWQHSKEFEGSLDCGLVQVQGKGTRAFLHSKLTRDFVTKVQTSSSSFQSACLLNGKGHVVDVIHVAFVPSPSVMNSGGDDEETTAFLLTSPGHSSTDLYRRLDPFVFPMDQVVLRDCSPSSTSDPTSGAGRAHMQQQQQQQRCYAFTVAAARLSSVHELFDRVIAPELNLWMRAEPNEAADDVRIELPAVEYSDAEKAAVYVPSSSKNGRLSLLIVPCTHVPECAVVGYTFYLWDDDEMDDQDNVGSAQQAGSSIWKTLMDDPEGPIHAGPLEWETLRIEAGQPRYRTEFTGGLQKRGRASSAKASSKETTGAPDEGTTEVASDGGTAVRLTPASPLELHLDSTLDLEKGCYLGQEGVASVLKNPRSPPRTMYQVVFDDEFNHYDGDVAVRDDDDDDGSTVENLTRPPAPGDALFVLGSNQEIAAGSITSVAEPGGTGEPITVGLALVPRADSILKRMADRELSVPDLATPRGVAGPLDGLEVIVGGTFTVGRLRSVPTLRYRQGENMFLDDNPTDDNTEESERWGPVQLEPNEDETPEDNAVDPWESDVTVALADDVAEPEQASEERDEAQAAAEAEAKRKAEKMELLRKRAEEAMARRKSKKSN